MKKSASKPSKKAPAIAIVIETSKPDKAMRKNKDIAKDTKSRKHLPA